MYYLRIHVCIHVRRVKNIYLDVIACEYLNTWHVRKDFKAVEVCIQEIKLL